MLRALSEIDRHRVLTVTRIVVKYDGENSPEFDVKGGAGEGKLRLKKGTAFKDGTRLAALTTESPSEVTMRVDDLTVIPAISLKRGRDVSVSWVLTSIRDEVARCLNVVRSLA